MCNFWGVHATIRGAAKAAQRAGAAVTKEILDSAITPGVTRRSLVDLQHIAPEGEAEVIFIPTEGASRVCAYFGAHPAARPKGNLLALDELADLVQIFGPNGHRI